MKVLFAFKKWFTAYLTAAVALLVFAVLPGSAAASSDSLKMVAVKTHSNYYICAEDGGGNEVVADRTQLGEWETFELIDLGNNKAAFRTYNGKFLSAENGGGGEVKANRSQVGDWETFELVRLREDKVALKTHNGKYVCAEDGGGSQLTANRSQVGDWETFQIVNSRYRVQKVERSGNVSFKAYNNKYICAENGGGREIIANRGEAGNWETFELVGVDDEKVALKASNKRYVYAESGGNITANSSSIGSSAKLELLDLGNDRVALKAYNGKFLYTGDGGRIAATGSEVNNRTIFELKPVKTVTVSKCELRATAGDKSIYFSWSKPNNTSGLIGYYLYRATSSGKQSNTPITDFPVTGNSYTDKNVENGTTYYYIVKCVYKDNVLGPASNEVSVKPNGSTSYKKTIVLNVGSKYMTVNGTRKEIDPGKGTTVVIKNGRTFLPIRATIEALGGDVDWDGARQKVTIKLKGTSIELYIGNKTAKVNGKNKETDVAPYLSDTDRTMLPLRFIIENLGCDVVWDGPTQSVTIKAQ